MDCGSNQLIGLKAHLCGILCWVSLEIVYQLFGTVVLIKSLLCTFFISVLWNVNLLHWCFQVFLIKWFNLPRCYCTEKVQMCIFYERRALPEDRHFVVGGPAVFVLPAISTARWFQCRARDLIYYAVLNLVKDLRDIHAVFDSWSNPLCGGVPATNSARQTLALLWIYHIIFCLFIF